MIRKLLTIVAVLLLNPGGLLPLERMQRTLRILTHEVIPAFR